MVAHFEHDGEEGHAEAGAKENRVNEETVKTRPVNKSIKKIMTKLAAVEAKVNTEVNTTKAQGGTMNIMTKLAGIEAKVYKEVNTAMPAYTWTALTPECYGADIFEASAMTLEDCQWGCSTYAGSGAPCKFITFTNGLFGSRCIYKSGVTSPYGCTGCDSEGYCRNTGVCDPAVGYCSSNYEQYSNGPDPIGVVAEAGADPLRAVASAAAGAMAGAAAGAAAGADAGAAAAAAVRASDG